MFRKIIVLAVVLSTLSTIGVATSLAEPTVGANNCLSVVYTIDLNSELSTLGGNNAIMVGSRVITTSNCGAYNLYIDGKMYSGGSEDHSFEISEGIHTIRLEGEDWNHTYSNMTFYPGSDVWVGEYPEGTELVKVSNKDLWWDEIMAHIVTVTILFFMSTTIVYRVAKWRIDRSIEVVV